MRAVLLLLRKQAEGEAGPRVMEKLLAGILYGWWKAREGHLNPSLFASKRMQWPWAG